MSTRIIYLIVGFTLSLITAQIQAAEYGVVLADNVKGFTTKNGKRLSQSEILSNAKQWPWVTYKVPTRSGMECNLYYDISADPATTVVIGKDGSFVAGTGGAGASDKFLITIDEKQKFDMPLYNPALGRMTGKNLESLIVAAKTGKEMHFYIHSMIYGGHHRKISLEGFKQGYAKYKECLARK